MGKVKLTKTQAEEIERIKKVGHSVKWKNDGWHVDRDEKLSELSFYKYINAIYEGYEVEPEFKVGDWAFIDVDELQHPRKILNIYQIDEKLHASFNGWSDIPIKQLKHATPQEVAAEKECRWWAKHDRKVWELKKGDIIRKFVVDGDFYEVTHVDGEYIGLFNLFGLRKETEEIDIVSGGYRVVCFVEDRKDI